MVTKIKKKIIFLAGPTAIGKSEFALNICEKVTNIQDGVRLASDALLSGKTMELIKNLKEAKNSLR